MAETRQQVLTEIRQLLNEKRNKEHKRMYTAHPTPKESSTKVHLHQKEWTLVKLQKLRDLLKQPKKRKPSTGAWSKPQVKDSAAVGGNKGKVTVQRPGVDITQERGFEFRYKQVGPQGGTAYFNKARRPKRRKPPQPRKP
jgi:hypothetical protein